jgi:hypothetical protein
MSEHWTPIHHEEIEPDPTPAAAPKPKPKSDEPKTLQGTPIPMAMSLLIPPDFIAAISALVGTQADLNKQISDLATKIDGLVEAMGRGNNDARNDAGDQPV